jgi:hypothetical protein
MGNASSVGEERRGFAAAIRSCRSENASSGVAIEFACLMTP